MTTDLDHEMVAHDYMRDAQRAVEVLADELEQLAVELRGYANAFPSTLATDSRTSPSSWSAEIVSHYTNRMGNGSARLWTMVYSAGKAEAHRAQTPAATPRAVGSVATEPEDRGRFMGIPPGARYTPALTHGDRLVVRDWDTDLVVPNSERDTVAEATAGMLCEPTARDVKRFTASYEWSVRPPRYDPEIWPTWVASETEARSKLVTYPDWDLVRRARWVAVGEWEEVS